MSSSSLFSMNDLSQSSFLIYLSIYLCVGQDTKSDFMFKILGRQLQWELTNDKVIEKLDTLIEEWLNKVNSISLSGCIKSWIVDNVVVSRFSWPLLIYDFPQFVVQNWSNRCIALQKMAENEQMCWNFLEIAKKNLDWDLKI